MHTDRLSFGIDVVNRSTDTTEVIDNRQGHSLMFSKTLVDGLLSIVLATTSQKPLFDDFTFIVKRELTWIPLFGWYLVVARQIAINRASGGAALDEATERATRQLNAGASITTASAGRFSSAARINFR